MNINSRFSHNKGSAITLKSLSGYQYVLKEIYGNVFTHLKILQLLQLFCFASIIIRKRKKKKYSYQLNIFSVSFTC